MATHTYPDFDENGNVWAGDGSETSRHDGMEFRLSQFVDERLHYNARLRLPAHRPSQHSSTQHFPLIQFYHAAKFGCCFSCWVPACIGGPKNLRTLHSPAPPNMKLWLTTRNTCYHTEFGHYRSEVGGSQNFEGHWDPLKMRACLTPWEHALSHHKFGRSRSNSWCAITEILQKSLTLRVPPFKVTRSHRNRHGSLGCLWTDVSVP